MHVTPSRAVIAISPSGMLRGSYIAVATGEWQRVQKWPTVPFDRLVIVCSNLWNIGETYA
jgi:hypothetical protein